MSQLSSLAKMFTTTLALQIFLCSHNLNDLRFETWDHVRWYVYHIKDIKERYDNGEDYEGKTWKYAYRFTSNWH